MFKTNFSGRKKLGDTASELPPHGYGPGTMTTLWRCEVVANARGFFVNIIATGR